MGDIRHCGRWRCSKHGLLVNAQITPDMKCRACDEATTPVACVTVPLTDYRGAVDPAVIVAWLRGRTGAHGGGFTSADDVADAIEREFIKPSEA